MNVYALTPPARKALALIRLRERVDDVKAAQAHVLEATHVALRHGATPAEIELITGHWPKAVDL